MQFSSEDRANKQTRLVQRERERERFWLKSEPTPGVSRSCNTLAREKLPNVGHGQLGTCELLPSRMPWGLRGRQRSGSEAKRSSEFCKQNIPRDTVASRTEVGVSTLEPELIGEECRGPVMWVSCTAALLSRVNPNHFSGNRAMHALQLDSGSGDCERLLRGCF